MVRRVSGEEPFEQRPYGVGEWATIGGIEIQERKSQV